MALGAGIAAVAALALAVFLVLPGDEADSPRDPEGGADGTAAAGPGTPSDGTATPAATVRVDPALVIEHDPALLDEIATAVGALPEGSGDTDRDQIESLVGVPDAFVVSYEVVGGEDETTGEVVRYETWVFFALRTAFEFADGTLVANLPVADLGGPALLPTFYEPSQFQRETTWADVEALIADPDAVATTVVPPELLEGTGSELTAYASDQLLVVFDQDGLVYAETIPLAP